MTSSMPRTSSWPVADLVLTGGLLVLFAWAFFAASDWSFRAALFPRFVSAFGLALSLLYLVRILRRGCRQSGDASGPSTAPSPIDAVDEAAEASPDYAFATAGARAWSRSLAWVTGFFVALYFLGIFVTAPLFAISYLRVSAGSSWRLSIIYGVVAGAVLYFALNSLLSIAAPTGALF